MILEILGRTILVGSGLLFLLIAGTLGVSEARANWREGDSLASVVNWGIVTLVALIAVAMLMLGITI